MMAGSRQVADPDPRTSRATRVAVVLAVVGIVLFFFLRAPTDPPLTAVAGAHTVDAGTPPLPPRCVPHGPKGGVVIGKATKGDNEGFVPFAAEVGRGVSLADGFALGVKHQIEGVMHAGVAVVDRDAKALEVHNLGKARGDVDAPLVVASGDEWVGASLEPNASGMSVRLFRVRDSDLQWGAEIGQGRDESLAYDMAFGKEVGVVAWDDVTDDRKRGVVMLATVTVAALEGGEKARVVSGAEVDAELPRVVLRPGGFWLAYVARARRVDDADAGAGPDGRFRAERIEPSWIELVPLDPRGAAVTEPSAVTSKEGYVLAFDLEPAADGNALITWRDADAPSGAHGGRVSSQLVTPSGAGNVQTIADEDVGAGVPTVLVGWMAIVKRDANLLLAPIGHDGGLTSPLRVEPLLREGQLIAAAKDVLLLAQPAGKAIRLVTVRCDSTAPTTPP